MNFLLFSGSLRTDSLNKKLIHVIKNELEKNSSHQVQVVDLKSLDIPVYDGDIEASGLPKGVSILGQHIQNTNAIIIASPEYNGSIAGPLKNTLDWVSRLRPMPFENKTVLITGASPGGYGAIRGLSATRLPFESMGSFVYPQTFGLAKAHEAFSTSGDLIDSQITKRLNGLLSQFLEFSKKLQ